MTAHKRKKYGKRKKDEGEEEETVTLETDAEWLENCMDELEIRKYTSSIDNGDDA